MPKTNTHLYCTIQEYCKLSLNINRTKFLPLGYSFSTAQPSLSRLGHCSDDVLIIIYKLIHWPRVSPMKGNLKKTKNLLQ